MAADEGQTVKMEKQLSQVDKVVEEEVVMPEMITSEEHHDDNDDSGCTSDGDNTDNSDDDTEEVSVSTSEMVNTPPASSDVITPAPVSSEVTTEAVSVSSSSMTMTNVTQVSERKQCSSIIRQNTYTVNPDLNEDTPDTEADTEPLVSDAEDAEDVDDVDGDSSLLMRQNTYTLDKMETLQSRVSLRQEHFSETRQSVEYKYEEPVYKEPDDTLDNDEDDLKVKEEVEEVKKKEDEYVTAEEVRNQKHKLLKNSQSSSVVTTEENRSSSVTTTVTHEEHRSQEPTLMEETSLASIAAARKQSVSEEKTEETMTEEKTEDTMTEEKTEDAMSRTSREVEQLINDIRDPNLDCSLDDIAAMIDGKDEQEKKQSSRGSPEFRTAATMIDQNPDKGFDPEDPAVKGLEDWECSNLTTSLESVEEKKGSKLKNALKRFSRHEETKSLLSDHQSSLNNNKEYQSYREDDEEEDKVSPGCIGTSLLYIFLKIFD